MKIIRKTGGNAIKMDVIRGKHEEIQKKTGGKTRYCLEVAYMNPTHTQNTNAPLLRSLQNKCIALSGGLIGVSDG